MSERITNLQLPFLAQGQAQKHVTVNESLLRLDALVQLAAASASTASQPASPSDGQIYVLPAGKTGADWGAMADGTLAYYRDGAWEEIAPREGWLAYICDADCLRAFDGTAWQDLPVSAATGAFAFTADITPAQITANQNDYAPTGLAGATVLRLSTDASRTLTGLSGGSDGRVLDILNVGSFDLVLANESASSAAANRFALGGDATIAAGGGASLIYDAAASRWRVRSQARPLGTAASKNVGASGDAVPVLNAANTFSASQTIQANSSVALSLGWTDDGANGVGVVTDKNSASPAASDDLFAITVQGRDSAAATAIYGTFSCRIAAATAGAHSGYWSYATRQAGVNTTVARFGGGVYHPSATGGDKGANTINFGAVYDDNTLLTCGPVEFLNSGAIDLDKWDALVPDRVHEAETEEGAHAARSPGSKEQRIVREGRVEKRRHEVMHAFAAMVADGFDPRDPDNFCARMKRDGAVPGLMTETEWRDMQARGDKIDVGTHTTRIFLALDNLAVAFAGAVDRIAALEAMLNGASARR
jgi:hypothetical protein